MRREEGGGEGEMEGESHKLEHHTLLFLKRYTIPVVSPFTASSFCFIIPPRFSLTSPTVSGGRREEGREGGRERGREREREGGTYNHSEPQTFLLIGTAGAWTRLKLLREGVICSNHLNSPSMPRLAKSSLARWYKWELFNSACTEDETIILT